MRENLESRSWVGESFQIFVKSGFQCKVSCSNGIFCKVDVSLEYEVGIEVIKLRSGTKGRKIWALEGGLEPIRVPALWKIKSSIENHHFGASKRAFWMVGSWPATTIWWVGFYGVLPPSGPYLTNLVREIFWGMVTIVLRRDFAIGHRPCPHRPCPHPFPQDSQCFWSPRFLVPGRRHFLRLRQGTPSDEHSNPTGAGFCLRQTRMIQGVGGLHG